MIGAIVGDIVGSRFEFDNHRSKVFDLFSQTCKVTDDTLMTLAVAKALMDTETQLGYPSADNLENYSAALRRNTILRMQQMGRDYPDGGYGGMFSQWIHHRNPAPYNSFGNGAAMRISPVGFYARSLSDTRRISAMVTGVTHNHPEGIKGAEAAAVCIFLARSGFTRDAIRRMVHEQYYPLSFTLDGIRDTYAFNETCQETVPQAIEAFLESTDFEDAIRSAISIGGDSDTLAAITGGIAEAYYGVPQSIKCRALEYLDDTLSGIVYEWQSFLKETQTPSQGG